MVMSSFQDRHLSSARFVLDLIVRTDRCLSRPFLSFFLDTLGFRCSYPPVGGSRLDAGTFGVFRCSPRGPFRKACSLSDSDSSPGLPLSPTVKEFRACVLACVVMTFLTAMVCLGCSLPASQLGRETKSNRPRGCFTSCLFYCLSHSVSVCPCPMGRNVSGHRCPDCSTSKNPPLTCCPTCGTMEVR